jgi:hypothetical protein
MTSQSQSTVLADTRTMKETRHKDDEEHEEINRASVAALLPKLRAREMRSTRFTLLTVSATGYLCRLSDSPIVVVQHAPEEIHQEPPLLLRKKDEEIGGDHSERPSVSRYKSR